MNRTALRALTWGTVGAAVASAMLLAASGDDDGLWRTGATGDAPGEGRRAVQRPVLGPAAVMPAPRPLGQASGRPGQS